MYHVRLPQFEGPFPLLFSLIEKEKLDITRLALAEVTDQYLAHIAREGSSLPNLAEFLSVAAQLLLLKSRALLPFLTLTEEEEEAVHDLESRLREYQRYKEAALGLEELFLRASKSFRRPPSLVFGPSFSPPPSVTVARLEETFSQIIARLPSRLLLEERVVEETVTLEERIAFLEARIRAKSEAAFSDILAESKDVAEKVVSFLALLELVRRKSVSAEQENIFGEIRFRRIV